MAHFDRFVAGNLPSVSRRRFNAGDDFEQRRLACSIGTDKSDDFTRADFEAYIRNRDKTAEALGEAADREQRRRVAD